MSLHKEYVLKAQAGDSEAFIHLMQEMELPLYRMALLMVKQEADCADAIQETAPLLPSTAAKACKTAVFSPLNFSVKEIPANLQQFPAIPIKMAS